MLPKTRPGVYSSGVSSAANSTGTVRMGSTSQKGLNIRWQDRKEEKRLRRNDCELIWVFQESWKSIYIYDETRIKFSPRHGGAGKFYIFYSQIRRGGALFWGGGNYHNWPVEQQRFRRLCKKKFNFVRASTFSLFAFPVIFRCGLFFIQESSDFLGGGMDEKRDSLLKGDNNHRFSAPKIHSRSHRNTEGEDPFLFKEPFWVPNQSALISAGRIHNPDH